MTSHFDRTSNVQFDPAKYQQMLKLYQDIKAKTDSDVSSDLSGTEKLTGELHELQDDLGVDQTTSLGKTVTAFQSFQSKYNLDSFHAADDNDDTGASAPKVGAGGMGGKVDGTKLMQQAERSRQAGAAQATGDISALGSGATPDQQYHSNQVTAYGSNADTSGVDMSNVQVSGQVGDWIKQAQDILSAPPPTGAGIPISQLPADVIATIIQKESGGNPNAVNNWDSNAQAGHPSQGLMQTIPSTFKAFMLPDHSQIKNPVDNIIAGVRYAVKTYGSLNNVPGIKKLAAGGRYVGY